MKKGNVIFLNGVSSSGKTTLAKALQEKLSEPYYWLANDTFCDMSPDKLWDIDQLETEYQALTMLHNTVKLFSDMGKNVIVDHVMLSVQKAGMLNECVNLLCDYPVLFVHVTCTLTELNKREKKRGDRNIGQAESQLITLNPQDTYDVTVNTSENSIDECVDKIIGLIENTDNYKAFKILNSQR